MDDDCLYNLLSNFFNPLLRFYYINKYGAPLYILHDYKQPILHLALPHRADTIFCFPGVTTSIVAPSPSVLPTSSSDSSTTPSVPPHTSTPPLSTITPTSSMALNSSSLPLTNGNTTSIADPATVTISLATVLSGVVILGCIIIILVLVLKHHRNSKSWCSNKCWGKEEELPANLFCSCNPPLMRQIAIPVDTALTPPPQCSVPSLPAQEVESKSDYDFVSFTPKVTPTKVGEEEVYHHLKRPVPKLSAPVEIYSQLHLSHRSSHTSLHSTSSSSSHHPCAPQHLGGHCPSCHGSQPLCSCCNESSHHCSGHLCTTCPGRSGHVCNGSDSLTNCEDEQTPMSTSLPVGHTQPSPTLSPLRATRPSYLPLNNSNVLPSSHNTTMPLHMKAPTSHLVPVPPPKKRSMSLTTIVEMPTPMTTPAGQRTEQRTSTPMPPLHTKLQQAAFSTHDIPAIVLSSGSPMTVVTNPMSIPAMCSLPSHHTTVSHNSRADTRTLKSTRENEVPSNAEPTPLKASSNLKPNLNSSLLSVQGRRSHKEDWVLPKLNHGSITSLNCREDRHCYSHSLPYYSSNSSHLQGIDARSDPGYETDRDTLNYKLVTIRKTTSLRLPDPASAKNETLV